MSRYRAFAIHFAISFAIFLGLSWVVLYVWYPGFFFQTDGGWEGMRIIIAVDLVLGPLLTLIVFKAGKPGLKFDLSAIAFTQAIALAAGLYIVHDERPLGMVYVDGIFYTVSRDDYTEVGMQLPDFDVFPGPYPKWIEVALPDDPFEQSDIRVQMLREKRPLRLMAERYQPFDPQRLKAKDAVEAAELTSREESTGLLTKWVHEHGGSAADYRFYPFGARYKYVYLAFAAQPERPLGLLEITSPYVPTAPG
ncbi:MAG: hypothetical protein HC809_08785 [Gammaproteobacteria bacterium]|nr:hypothetical protein [Gammaproteobacteria bacterium]